MEPESQRERVVRWSDPLASFEMTHGLSGREILNRIRDGAIPLPPYAVLLGVRLVEVDSGRVVFEAEPGEEHYNPMGVVHGGLAMSLLDFALGSAIFSTLPADTVYGTVDVHARLLRPITKDTGIVRCEAQIVSSTRTLATSEARVTDAKNKILATGTTACIIRSLV